MRNGDGVSEKWGGGLAADQGLHAPRKQDLRDAFTGTSAKKLVKFPLICSSVLCHLHAFKDALCIEMCDGLKPH